MLELGSKGDVIYNCLATCVLKFALLNYCELDQVQNQLETNELQTCPNHCPKLELVISIL